MLTTEQSLRQFCRLLTADRLFGDEIVAITLAEDIPGENEAQKRVEAFKRLLSFWAMAYEARETAPNFTDLSLLASAGAPPSKIQTALLLSDVLQMPEKDIAQILAPTDSSVTELVVTGRVMHASRAKGKTIIVEDEPVIASDLRYIVEQLGATVAGTAESADKAVDLITRNKPDLILTDYNLVDEKTGIDVVEESRKVHQCPVVFVTAFPEEVLSGRDGEPDVVIGKPYTLDGIKAAVVQSLTARRLEILK